MKNKEELKSCFEGDELYLGGYVKNKIDQLDEPETLSQEWLDEKSFPIIHQAREKDVVPVKDLKDKLVPKQRLPVIPKFVADWIEFKKKSRIPYENVLQAIDELVNSSTSKAHDWALKTSENKDTFARAWLDDYTVEEEQRYYALIKGHENIGSDDKYWNYCITDESLDIGDNRVHTDVLAEYVLNATKDEWENLGINGDNADFVEVEEMEE